MTTRLEAVIFDWAGTTVDFGSLAPVLAIREAFASRGVEVSNAQARRDMGLLKRDQIALLLDAEDVRRQWMERFGDVPAGPDLDRLVADFAPIQMRRIAENARLIPGTAETISCLRRRGMKIGSTTGYTRPMLDLVLECARGQGYAPDASLAPDDVGGGRPKPWMCYRLAMEFRVSSSAACVKIGDTAADIAEGRNAGMWTVAVAATGNEAGLSEEEFTALDSDERAKTVASARCRLLAAGADCAIDSVADCEGALDEIERRLRDGKRP